jgi:hypothetical protein
MGFDLGSVGGAAEKEPMAAIGLVAVHTSDAMHGHLDHRGARQVLQVIQSSQIPWVDETVRQLAG